ncbi:MAG: hypothetical protein M3O01_10550 [Pseudomonadota bacterium]|nr:hypothetical protein [Pseudomonadota bacterium]
MQVRKNKNTLRPLRRPIVVALASFAACAAQADEPSPWYIGASEAITHDSNVNRISDNSAVSDPDGKGDTYSSTSLLGGFDQAYSRQHFYGRATVSYNKYMHHGYLDNVSYGLGAGWDWATIWDLSGGFFASTNQSLAQLNGNQPAQSVSFSRNEVRADQYGANVNWGGAGPLSVRGSLTHSKVSYSRTAANVSDSSANSASLGLYYAVGPTLTTGIAYRVTRTEANDINGHPYTSDGRNIDLSADWRYSVQTGVNARLSFTRQGDSGGSGNSFSGITGALGATYAPTAKVGLSANVARDAGTNGTFFNVPVTTGTTTAPATTSTGYYQNSTVADTLSLGASYAATAKIGVNAGYSYRSATINAGPAGEYKDNLQIASLGVSWAVARAWTLGCNVSREKRDTQSTPAFTYTANVVGCSAQVMLR